MVSSKRSSGVGSTPGNIYDEIERRQIERREISLSGPVDESMAYVAGVKLRYMLEISKEPVTIYLNTTGGSISDGLAIYDEIKRIRSKGVKVTVIAAGNCMSMGTIILQAATHRLSMENTSFLLHELSMVNVGSLGQQKDRHSQALKLQATLNNILMQRMGIKKGELNGLIERTDRFLTPKEAKKYGLIDGVL